MFHIRLLKVKRTKPEEVETSKRLTGYVLSKHAKWLAIIIVALLLPAGYVAVSRYLSDSDYRWSGTGYFGKKVTYRLSNEEMLELQKRTPFLTLESCGKYRPDQLFQKYLDETDKGISVPEFGSEAGEDGFDLILAMMMQREVNRSLKNSDSLREQLEAVLNYVNGSFERFSDGGTMYCHMDQRIPAYTEWYIWHGIGNHFRVNEHLSEKDIEAQIKKTAATYGLSAEKINRDFSPLRIKEGKYRSWVLEKASDFIAISIY